MPFPKRENIALGLSAVAVFAALGGPSWAAKSLNGKRLKNGSVTNAKLARNAVTTAKIANSTIRSVDVRNGSLGRSDVRPDFFSGLQSALTANSITTFFLANDAVTTDKIANQAVTGVKINQGAVSTSRLLNNAVTSAKIDDGTIGSADIGDDAVTSSEIGRNAVTGAELDAAGSTVVDAPAITDGTCVTQTVSVTGADLSDDAIAVTPPNITAPVSVYATVQSATQFTINVCAMAATTDTAVDGTYRWVAVQAA